MGKSRKPQKPKSNRRNVVKNLKRIKKNNEVLSNTKKRITQLN